MRRSVLAVIAMLSLFTLAAAAASQLSVNGASNPRAGTAASTTCDVGSIDLATNNDGTDVTSFTLTTSNDTSGVAECANFDIYLKVAATGADAPASGSFFLEAVPAQADYTGGYTFEISGSAPVGHAVFADYPTATQVTTAPAITDLTVGTTSVVVAASAPSGASDANPAARSGWGA